jgi:hypothetical protein
METQKIVSLPAELARAIEGYRFNNRLKTEAEAIRRLIERGLATGGHDHIAIRRREPVVAGKSAPSRAQKPPVSREEEPQ